MFILDTTAVLCDQIPPEISHITRTVVTIIQIAVPVMLIIWGMLDFGKAVVAGDEKKVKEAQGLFIKRAVSAIAVFLMIAIVRGVLGIFVSGEEAGATNAALECAFTLIGR